jgi:hypothetical protein
VPSPLSLCDPLASRPCRCYLWSHHN